MARRFSFGKYAGVPLAEVPGEYLAWAAGTLRLGSGLRAAAVAELANRGLPAPAVPPRAEPTCCGPMAYRWTADAWGRRLIKRSCGGCGRGLGFAPRTEPYASMADAAAVANEKGVTA